MTDEEIAQAIKAAQRTAVEAAGTELFKLVNSFIGLTALSHKKFV